ncbi:MAG: GNAT family N-acetyltransferase [Anaerolineales bacterium]
MVDRTAVWIRPATEADLLALEWDGEYTHYRRMYRHAMQDSKRGNRVLLVAEVDDEIIGQIFVYFRPSWSRHFPNEQAGYLHSFRVKPQFRKQGIGTSLVRHAESILIERAYHRSVISVAKDNLDAVRLYQSLGYSIFTEDPGQWSYVDHLGRVQQVVEPVHLMQKRLTPE